MTLKVFRVDAGTLRAPVHTPQGFLRVDGYIGRPGIYSYINTDEDEKLGLGKKGAIRRELRPEEEVFRTDSLEAYDGISITVGHPPRGTDVNAENVRKFEVGTVLGKAFRDGNRAAAALLIKDKAAQARVDSRELTELSPGYHLEIDQTPGVHPVWGPYDVVQRDIMPNHLALVKRARGGSDIAMRLDEADMDAQLLSIEEREALSIDAKGSAATQRQEGHMADKTGGADAPEMGADEQVRLLKTRCDEADKLIVARQDALDSAQKRADAAEATLKTRDEEIAQLKAQLAAGSKAMETEAIRAQATRADEAERKLSERERSIPAEVEFRGTLVAKCRAVMGPQTRIDGVDNRTLAAATVKHLAPNEDVRAVKEGGPSDAYLFTRLDGLIEARQATARSYTRASEVLSGDRADEAPVNKREQRAKEWREQWKKPLPSSNAARERQKEA